MYALNVNPSLFNALFLFSPNLEYGNNQLVDSFAMTYHKFSVLNKFLYVSVGDDSGYESIYRPGINKLDSVATSGRLRNFIFKFDYLNNCNHFESPQISLPLAISAYKTLYGYASVPEREKFLTSKTGYLNEIKNFYEGKVNILGYLYEPGIDVIKNEFAYYALDRNKTEQAVDVVNWGIKLYPDNYFTPSLFLTKSYILEKKDDINAALKSCESALDFLETHKEKMNGEDYKYTTEELKNRLQELLKKSN